eukprot:998442-Prymnesium_polylepis.1
MDDASTICSGETGAARAGIVRSRYSITASRSAAARSHPRVSAQPRGVGVRVRANRYAYAK